MSESFTPSPGATVNIDVSDTSQSVALGISTRGPVRIANDGTATVWVKFGKSGVAADADEDMPVGPGFCEVVTLPLYGAPAYVAAIAEGSTGKIYFTPGPSGI
jgi:hypothetical protein